MKEAETNKKEALTEKDVENVRSAVEKAAKAKAEANPKDAERFKELLNQAKMPVEIEDKDFIDAMAALGQKIDYLDGPAYGEYLAQAAIDVPAAMAVVGLVEEEAA